MSISATDVRVDRWLYKKDLFHEIFIGDLSNGYLEISSNSYDVVVCEQVLEHLPRIDAAVATLAEQAFSQFTILHKLKQNPKLRLLAVRGFRVISGGLLRPLENYHWWWKLNRRIGTLVPAAWIEIQVIVTKIKAD
jgi:2-polyprenyl-3-methyl-5-hydroxy-6-metoxy-1,4-benzoquinol methylase